MPTTASRSYGQVLAPIPWDPSISVRCYSKRKWDSAARMYDFRLRLAKVQADRRARKQRQGNNHE